MEAGSAVVQAALIAGMQWCSWQGPGEGGGHMQKLSTAGGVKRRCCDARTVAWPPGEHGSVGQGFLA